MFKRREKTFFRAAKKQVRRCSCWRGKRPDHPLHRGQNFNENVSFTARSRYLYKLQDILAELSNVNNEEFIGIDHEDVKHEAQKGLENRERSGYIAESRGTSYTDSHLASGAMDPFAEDEDSERRSFQSVEGVRSSTFASALAKAAAKASSAQTGSKSKPVSAPSNRLLKVHHPIPGFTNPQPPHVGGSLTFLPLPPRPQKPPHTNVRLPPPSAPHARLRTTTR